MGRVLSKNHLAPEPYLLPYLRAADKHGAEFPSLLWASPQTQAARFDQKPGALHRLGGGLAAVVDAGEQVGVNVNSAEGHGSFLRRAMVKSPWR